MQQLSERLAILGCDLMKRTIDGIVAGTLHPTPQDPALRNAGANPHKRKTEISIGAFPLARSTTGCAHFIPGRDPRRRFATGLQDSQSASEGKARGPDMAACRELLLSGNGAERFLGVVCGDGILLELLEVQLPNRKPQTGMDFVNGFRIAPVKNLAMCE